METTKLLYLEDLHVGQRFVSSSLPMTHESIIEFARNFDPQPFHLDDEAARKTLFGGLAASGWHTAAMTMRLLVEGGAPLAGGIIGGGGEVVWPMPTRPGDVLHVETEVAEIRPSRSKPQQGMVYLSCSTINQHGQVVQTLTARLVVPRRPAAG